MKVLVLGSGEMAETAIQDLYTFGEFDEILLGSRNPVQAEKVISGLHGKGAKVSTTPIDVSNTAALAGLMNGFEVVVNCVGPNFRYEYSVAQAAIAARVNLVDLNDEFETTFKMLVLDAKAKAAGMTIILGLGASPGVNNVLVRAAANQLDEVEEIHTAWVMSGADPGGLALSYHLLYSLSGKALTFQDRKMVEVRSFEDGKERIEFPEPVGAMDVYHIGHPEPITLSRCFNGVNYVDDKASFNPPFINDLILRLGRLVREADGPIRVAGREIEAMDFAAAYLHQQCKNLKNVPLDGALRVAVQGRKGSKRKKIVFSSAGRLAAGTGIPAAIGAIMLAHGKIKAKGVLPPEECVEPNDFLYEMLNRRNVAKLNGWIED
jgi:saccharopine dehydrogenase (NAD+, L-lysine-forming)